MFPEGLIAPGRRQNRRNSDDQRRSRRGGRAAERNPRQGVSRVGGVWPWQEGRRGRGNDWSRTGSGARGRLGQGDLWWEGGGEGRGRVGGLRTCGGRGRERGFVGPPFRASSTQAAPLSPLPAGSRMVGSSTALWR